MAFQIIPETSFASSLGSSLGQGLGQGLQQLASQKLQSMQRQKMVPGLQALLPNLPEDQLQSLIQLDPTILNTVLKQKLKEPGQQEYAREIQRALGIEQPQQEFEERPLIEEIQQRPEFSTMDAIRSLNEAKLGITPQGFPTGKAAKEVLSKPQMVERKIQQTISPEFKYNPNLSPEQNLQLAKAHQQQKKLALAERKESREEKLAAYKLTKDERKEINDRVKLAKTNLHELNRLDELENENLESAGYYEFLNRSGLDIPALMNPASEEYDKISRGFIRSGKAIFGSRVTDNDLNQLLKMIPTLSMSPEGRKRVRSDMKYMARADEAYGQAMREVIKENNGIPPYDLSEQIEEKIGPKLDVIARKFKEDLKKPAPKGQNKLITAFQAGLGNLSGAFPGALKGAAKGAIVGSVVPGLGTGTGAALGALGGGTGLI